MQERWSRVIGFSALLVGLLWAGRLLCANPCLGVADNLDFWRVMRPAGIDHRAPLVAPGYYVVCEFAVARADFLSGPSSAAALAWVARIFSSKDPTGATVMQLRQIGLVYLALLAIILGLGIRAGFPVLTAALLAYVVIDPGYLLFFNSFYADPPMILGLVAASIWLERETRRILTAAVPYFSKTFPPLLSLGLIALAGGGSKMQYVVFPSALAAALAPSLLGWSNRPRRNAVIALALIACVQVACAWNFFFGPGPRFVTFNNYHAVFGGIAALSSNPDQALERLGVPSEYRGLPRTDAWSAAVGPDHPVHRYLANLDRFGLLAEYLHDSTARGRALHEIGNLLARADTHPRGNLIRQYDDRGPVRRVFRTPWQYSALLRDPILRSPAAVAWLVVASGLWLAVSFLRRSCYGARASMLLLWIWSVSQCGVALLGEGLVNLHQHLLGARLGLDLLSVFLAVDVLSAVWRRRVELYRWWPTSRRRSPSSPAASETASTPLGCSR